MKLPGENTELQCEHSDSELFVILWYQQSLNNTSMKLIAHLYYKKIQIENSFSSRFNVSGDGEKQSTLHLIKLTAAEHSGVYYCAASKHSAPSPLSLLQKLSLLKSHWIIPYF